MRDLIIGIPLYMLISYYSKRYVEWTVFLVAPLFYRKINNSKLTGHKNYEKNFQSLNLIGWYPNNGFHKSNSRRQIDLPII